MKGKAMTDKEIIEIIQAYAKAKQYIKILEDSIGRKIDVERGKNKQTGKRK